jgi:pyrroloquinoline quinone (PQQ) biosynthesis protein C
MEPFAKALEAGAGVMRAGAQSRPDNDWLGRTPEYHIARAEEHSGSCAKAISVSAGAKLTREAPLPSGLAAIYVYESQIAELAAVKIDGLKRFYGIADEDGVKFFTVHRETDRHHARAIARLIEIRSWLS